MRQLDYTIAILLLHRSPVQLSRQKFRAIFESHCRQGLGFYLPGAKTVASG